MGKPLLQHSELFAFWFVDNCIPLYLRFYSFVVLSGDHTVKIIHCQSGSCLKVLSGHRRTPWVVSLSCASTH